MSHAVPKVTEPVPPPVSPTTMIFLVMVVATVIGMVWLARELSDPAALPIRRVMVEGEFKHLTTEHVQRAVVGAVHAGFFGVDVTDIRRLLQDEAWIRDANVSRMWPDGLHVTIVEQIPVARWGDYGLLNERADIFVPAAEDLPRDLVQLNGPLGSEQEVLERFAYIRDELATIGLKAVALSLSDRRAWTITTEGGREILLGRRSLEERLARFKWGYTKGLNAAWERIGHVDMRYTNGFAVGERGSARRNG
jgi:cell division protein FtsQ